MSSFRVHWEELIFKGSTATRQRPTVTQKESSRVGWVDSTLELPERGSLEVAASRAVFDQFGRLERYMQ